MSAPAEQTLRAADVTQAQLPENVVARAYAGEVEQVAAVPRPRMTVLASLMRILPSRRMHVLAMRADPMGYWQSVVSGMGLDATPFGALLQRGDSPVVQAYLRYAAKPDSRKAERDLVKTMLRALKAQGEKAQTPAELAALELAVGTFSDLAKALGALTPSLVMGEWDQAARAGLSGRAIHVPGVLLEIGGKGALGAYYDLLHRLPAKIDENVLEQQRRRLFRSTAVAA